MKKAAEKKALGVKFAKKFDKVNRANIKLENRSNRTKTGALKTGRVRAHTNVKMA